jgi:ubiquinone/menaquinone biosynthesis C-methylase UbiE
MFKRLFGEKTDESGKNLYLTDEYIKRNPSLDLEDHAWKICKIIPFVDKSVNCLDKDEINLLDVGGGAGRILNELSAYIEGNYGLKVNKLALDLSPGMLEIQKKKNPDLRKALNEDIRQASLDDKEVDITLMIDVLEHVPTPNEALEELKRISQFVIFKVPLDHNLLSWVSNLMSKGKTRKLMVETVGHINVYNVKELVYQVEKHVGQILNSSFMNSSEYIQTAEYYKGKRSMKGKLNDLFARYVFMLSPELCSLLFGDFLMMLVKCYPANGYKPS